MLQKLFFNNYLLMLPIISWVAAQICKTILDFVVNGSFSRERLVGAGGMPSSHSALVCSFLVGTARKLGPQSPLFALAFVLAAVVMYDAMGVRRETGRQAKVINKILDDLRGDGPQQEGSQTQKLKEMVGHSPLQVLSGALLGILIAIIIPVF